MKHVGRVMSFLTMRNVWMYRAYCVCGWKHDGTTFVDAERALAAHYAENPDTPDAKTERCPTCNGTGVNPMSDNLNWLPCATCHGDTKVTPAMVAYLTRLAMP